MGGTLLGLLGRIGHTCSIRLNGSLVNEWGLIKLIGNNGGMVSKHV